VDASRTRNEDAAKDKSASSTGSGLGLAIVESIAKIHNGNVEVQSELGKGTIFEITFPLYVESAKSSSTR
jgi:signal transduction histidine kinase